MEITATGSLQRRPHARRALSDDAASARARWTAASVLTGALLACATCAEAAAGADPLHSRECLRARAELEAALAAPHARHSARLERARGRALHACLGSDAGARERTGAPQPPRRVPPTLVGPPPGMGPVLPQAPPATAAPPPVQVPRPTAITTCDPAGCWDSEGRRLNRMGPQLIGPNGVCTTQGGLVTCP